MLVKPLANGDRAVVLFNATSHRATITTSASAIGMPPAPSYRLLNLWTDTGTSTSGGINARVASHATVMYRVSTR